MKMLSLNPDKSSGRMGLMKFPDSLKYLKLTLPIVAFILLNISILAQDKDEKDEDATAKVRVNREGKGAGARQRLKRLREWQKKRKKNQAESSEHTVGHKRLAPRGNPGKKGQKAGEETDNKGQWSQGGRKRPGAGQYRGTEGYPVLQRFLQSISEEEKVKLKNSMRQDPEKFRAAMREKFQKWRENNRKKDQTRYDMHMLKRQYHHTEDPKQKEEILKNIRAKAGTAFDARMKENEERLKQLEARVEELRQEFEKRKRYREKIIKERVKEITRDPGMKRQGRGQSPKATGGF